jgi:anti-sigma regulatory factor (Ser/Thr protein kinase)
VRELALHLLDIAENSVAANATNINISVIENTSSDLLRMVVIDDGKGMDAATVTRVTDPFVTSRTTRKVGLGLPFLKQAAEMCNGSLEIQSEVGKGTQVSVEFQRSHIDRMPLGDLASTFLSLFISSPEIHWMFIAGLDDRSFEFDSAPVMEELDGISLTEPTILTYLRDLFENGIHELEPQTE